MAEDVALFLFICMLIGQVFKLLSMWSGIPYTSMITVIGGLLGLYYEKIGSMQIALKLWSDMPPHLLLFAFIPALIFESAFSTDWHIFKIQFGQVLLMAGPMLIASTFLSAAMMAFVYGYTDTNKESAVTADLSSEK